MILYKTYCDECDKHIRNSMEGIVCDVCGKDFCLECKGQTYYISWGDEFFEEMINLCKSCNQNPPERIKRIIDKMDKLQKTEEESWELVEEIRKEIRELKKVVR